MTIYDQDGMIVGEGETPFRVELDRGVGFFEKAKYRVVIEHRGYETHELWIRGNIDGWYVAGNFLFGGLLGWVIIDPVSGAMWQLQPKRVNVNLKRS